MGPSSLLASPSPAAAGLGTDDRTLVRIVATRCEVDMVEIKQAFLEIHHKTLAKMIEGDTSGHFKHLLIKLVGEN